MATPKGYYCTGLTGGTADDLDGIDGANLSDKDVAIVFTGSVSYFYRLDADAGLSESSPNVIVPDTNADTKCWILQAAMAGLPKDHLNGFVLSVNSTDSDHDIDISAGECRDADDTDDIVLSSSLTKQIDAAWAEGTNAGGLDTGTVAADTLYAVWAIKKSSTGDVDILISASFSAPTMPTGWDKKQLVGWRLTDSSANIVNMKQIGKGKRVEYWLKARLAVGSGLSSSTYTTLDLSSYLPTAAGIVDEVLFGATCDTAANVSFFYLSDDGVNLKTVTSGSGNNNAIGDRYELYYWPDAQPEPVPLDGNNLHYKQTNAAGTLYIRKVYWSR